MATHVVTGAFSYTGKYIARRLLAEGVNVRTLTNHPHRDDSMSADIEVFPLDFDDHDALVKALTGATTLYNTYWIRFPRGPLTFDQAVANSQAMFKAAEAAGVRRIVHVSVASALTAPPLLYFLGKQAVEEAVMASGLSHAIIRPTVSFGDDDILLNNIAWGLRRFPVFAVPGYREYSLQPVHVDDVAKLAVEAGFGADNVVMDAAGPERYTYTELVRLVAEVIGVRARVVKLPPFAVRLLAMGMGTKVHDTILTRDEIRGLMANLLVSDDPPTGETSLKAWLAEHRDVVGTRYNSEMDRNYR